MTIFRVPINISWNGGGSPGVNVWHLRVVDVAGSFTQGDLDGGISAIHDFYGAAYQALAPGAMVTLGDIVNVADKTMATSTFTPIQQSSGGSTAPPALQICVGWRTSIAARRAMGRTFIGPLSSAAVDADGTPTTAMLSILQTAGNALVASSTGTSWAGAVGVYGLQDQAPKGTPPGNLHLLPHVLRDITACKIKDRFAVLRSRRD